MSITISVDNYCEVVEKELLSKFSPEDIKRMENFNDSETFREYQDNIKTVEYKYSMNLSNGNFHELWIMLNLKIEEYDTCGEISGYELIELKNKLESLLNTIKSVPEQFSVPTEEIKEEGKATFIIIGKNSEYWERLITDLLNLIDKTDKIHWG